MARHYGLSVTDFNGRSFVVSDQKGRRSLATDLGELWPAAALLTPRPLDPLDPHLLDAL